MGNLLQECLCLPLCRSARARRACPQTWGVHVSPAVPEGEERSSALPRPCLVFSRELSSWKQTQQLSSKHSPCFCSALPAARLLLAQWSSGQKGVGTARGCLIQLGTGLLLPALGSRNLCPANAVRKRKLTLAQGSVFHNCRQALPEHDNLISDGTQIHPGPNLVDVKDQVPSPRGFCRPTGCGLGGMGKGAAGMFQSGGICALLCCLISFPRSREACLSWDLFQTKVNLFLSNKAMRVCLPAAAGGF